jgi:hypothetical protein
MSTEPLDPTPAEVPNRAGAALAAILAVLADLSDCRERAYVFQRLGDTYCLYCGRHSPCHCDAAFDE